MKGFSSSMNRATIVFTMPDVGRTAVQENAGCVDENLRKAIKKAFATFEKEYERLNRFRPKSAVRNG